jgi:response regulator NasT
LYDPDSEKTGGEPPAITTPRRILVAEDEHLVAQGIAQALRALAYEVIGPVADGDAATAIARTDHPDLALLDIRMPQRDGLSAAESLWKELEIPSVILSAYSSQQYVDEAQRVGVFGYLLKPITGEALRATINVAWARASSHVAQSHRIDQLERSLAVRKTVEMAKWRLIEARRITEADAHALLQRTARNERRRLIDLAEDLLKSTDHPLLQPARTGSRER